MIPNNLLIFNWLVHLFMIIDHRYHHSYCTK